MSPPSALHRKRRFSPDDSNDDQDSTDVKLALLLSLHPETPLPTLLEALLANDGSVSSASSSLVLTPGDNTTMQLAPRAPSSAISQPERRPMKQPRQQSTLHTFLRSPPTTTTAPKPQLRPPKKGGTIHLYTPAAVSSAPCPAELLQSFLPATLATSLLEELLEESETFAPPAIFRLFERDVTSPHTAGLFLRDPTEKDAYYSYQSRPMAARPYTPSMRAATALVEAAVEAAIAARWEKKPWGLSSVRWSTNAAFVNRYAGPHQAVGYHMDEATYIGPMAVIAGLSLGVEREFRVRRVHRLEDDDEKEGGGGEEAEGAYSIHLPHNSLLIMHAGMQEGWKHCIHPARTVEPHPISGDVRISITYRCYRRSMRPEMTPRCKCKLPTILRAVFGPDPLDLNTPRRYFWACAAPYRSEKDGQGCGFFQWGEFDVDGDPVWIKGGGS